MVHEAKDGSNGLADAQPLSDEQRDAFRAVLQIHRQGGRELTADEALEFARRPMLIWPRSTRVGKRGRGRPPKEPKSTTEMRARRRALIARFETVPANARRQAPSARAARLKVGEAKREFVAETAARLLEQGVKRYKLVSRVTNESQRTSDLAMSSGHARKLLRKLGFLPK
jgi:hypothetical protein